MYVTLCASTDWQKVALKTQNKKCWTTESELTNWWALGLCQGSDARGKLTHLTFSLTAEHTSRQIHICTGDPVPEAPDTRASSPSNRIEFPQNWQISRSTESKQLSWYIFQLCHKALPAFLHLTSTEVDLSDQERFFSQSQGYKSFDAFTSAWHFNNTDGITPSL